MNDFSLPAEASSILVALGAGLLIAAYWVGWWLTRAA
jgi:hypothetical protein